VPDTAATLIIPRQREQDQPCHVKRELVEAMIDLHPGGMVWRRTFPGTFDQIPAARHFTRFLLLDSPCRDDAEQIVAELADQAGYEGGDAIGHRVWAQIHSPFSARTTRF
jgi:hypothetical protein